jgi:phage-related minor tail protein
MSSFSGMSSASQGEIEGVTAKALDLASAFDVDVAEATNAAGVLMTTGLAGNATEAMDLVTVAMQKVPAQMRGEVFPIVEEYSKHFATLGLDGETAMGMIVGASAGGMQAIDKTGDALKEFSLKAVSAAGDKTLTAAFDSIGLSATDMSRAMAVGGAEGQAAMKATAEGLLKIEDPAERAQTAIALFGTPLEDLGTDQIPNFLSSLAGTGDVMGDVAGQSAEFSKTLNSGPNTAMLTLQRTADTAFAGIATAVLPVLMEVTSWLSQNQWAFTAIAGVIGVTLVAAFIGWAASAWAVTAALLANPVTWIVLGIVALIAALVLLIMNWDAVVAWASQVWGGFVNWVGEVFAGLGTWLGEIWSGISSWFMGALSAFGSWWTGMWGGFFNWVGEIFGGFGNWIMSIWSGISSWFMGALGAFGSWWSGLWSGVVSWATGILNGFLGFVGSIPGAIMAGLAWLANLAGVVAGYFGSMAAAAWAKALELVGWVGSLPGMIVGAVGNLGGLLIGAGQSIIQGFLDGLTAGFEAVKGFVGGIADWIAANKGPKAYDEALLIPAGGWIMGGLEKGLRAEIPALEKTLGDITGVIRVGTVDPVGFDVAGSVSGAAAAAGAVAGTGYGPAPVGAGGVVNNIEVNNPVPEPAGASITGALAKAAYLGLDGGE